MAWFSVNTSNTSLENSLSDEPRDERLAQVEIALLSIVFITSGSLNVGLLLVLWKRRKQLTRMRVFVFHLCVADLVVTFFQVCPQLMWDITDRFIGPDLLCRAVKYLQVVGMFASTYMIVVMTIDRYQAVCDPMVTFQRRRARWNGSVYMLSYTIIFVLPVLTVIACQVRICRAVHTNLHMKTHRAAEVVSKPLSSRASSVAGVSKAWVETVRMTVVVVLAYILCWAPFFTVQLWSVWDVQTATFTVLMLLASLNSCVNPCIYLVFSGKMPKKLLTLTCVSEPDRKESMQEEATVVSSLYISLKGLSDNR